jgi:hypothetical protein
MHVFTANPSININAHDAAGASQFEPLNRVWSDEIPQLAAETKWRRIRFLTKILKI